MDHSQINQLYERYKTGIYRFAFSILQDEHLAEDVLQETFLRLLSGNRGPAPGKEQAWLYKVARNLCYDYLRKQKRQTDEQSEVYHESRYSYFTLLSPLSETDRQIVTLKINGGLTHREIASVMGITPHAAQKRYERAIEKLREDQDGE